MGKGRWAPREDPAARGVAGRGGRGRVVNLQRGWRCQSFVSGGQPQTTTRTFPGEPRVLSPRPGLRGRRGGPARDSPSWGVGFPDSWGRFEAAKFRASCGRRVWVLSTRPRPALRLDFSLYTEKIRGGSGLSGPPLPSGGARVSQQPHSQPGTLTGRRRVPLRPPRRLLGPGDGAESDARPRPRLPLALAPLRLAVGSTSHGLGATRLAGATRGWPRPSRLPAPPPSGARSPQPGGPPHSLSQSPNCQGAPGGC